MTKQKYVVTANVYNHPSVNNGARTEITEPRSKARALKMKHNLEKEMKIAIPKYRWAKNIRVKKK